MAWLRGRVAVDAGMRHSSEVSRLTVVSATLIVFAYRMLYVWQGLDLTDTGFLVAGYRHFLTDPGSNTYFLANWLTFLFGYLAGEALGGTLLAYRIAWAGVVAATAGFATATALRVLPHPIPVLVSVSVGSIVATMRMTSGVGYDGLTVLALVVAVWLVVTATPPSGSWRVVAAGVVLGAAVFVRLPNLVVLPLVVPLAALAWRHPAVRGDAFRHAGRFVAGWLLGFSFVAAMIVAFAHHVEVLASLMALLNRGADGGSTHAFERLVLMAVHDHGFAILLGAGVLAGGWLVVRISEFLPPLVRCLALLLAAIVLANALGFKDAWRYAIPGASWLSLSYVAWREWTRRPRLALAAVGAMLVPFVVPLGSDGGIHKALFGTALPITVLLTWWVDCARSDRRTIPGTRRTSSGFVAARLFATGLLMLGISQQWTTTYRDTNVRMAMVHAVPHPLLAGTFTTQARSLSLAELIDALMVRVPPGERLLAYPVLPLVHFLTDAQAFVGTTWPVLLPAEELEERLAATWARGERPVVVRARGRVSGSSWPGTVEPFGSEDRDEARAVLDRFVEGVGYHVTWSNTMFEILEADVGVDVVE